MRIVKQDRFKNLCELHKEWTESGVKASRATTHRRVEEFGYSCHQRRLTWAKEKKNWTVAQWSKVLFSDESCFKSRVKFPQLVMIRGAMSSAGVGPLCFLKTNVIASFTKTFWSTSCFLLLTSFLKMLISFSSRIWHLPTLPKAPKVG